MSKKEKIILKAIELFAKDGYHNTSTAKIAREAGTANGLIFHHFTNKQGLLLEVIGYLRQRISRILYLDITQAADVALIQLIERIRGEVKEKDFWVLYHALVFQPGLSQIMIEELGGLFKTYQQDLESVFRELGYPDPPHTTRKFEALRSGIILTFLHEDESYPVDQMLEELIVFSEKQ